MLRKYIAIFSLFLSGCVAQNQFENVDYSQAAKTNVQLGLGYLQEKQVVRAKEKLLLAEQQAPDSPDVLQGLAYFYQVTSMPIKANDFYQRALKKQPSNSSIMNNYAVFLCQQKAYKKAITLFLQAANEESNAAPAEAYENAGLCALKIPNQQQAKQYFSQALAADPNRPVSLLYLAK